MERVEFAILVMWALSLTKSFGKRVKSLTRWILADSSNREKFLWKFINTSTPVARQWMVEFVNALERGTPPPPPPAGLPQLFSKVPKDLDLKKLMNRPVVYVVTGKPSIERGSNEVVAEAVERAAALGIKLNVAELMAVYVGIARGAGGFITRMKRYVVSTLSTTIEYREY